MVRAGMVVLGATLLLPAVAMADQLKCNDKAVAQAAAALLKEGVIILDYCSQCEDEVRVVRVRLAAAVEDCQWELEVAGRVIWESENTFEAGYDPRQARFKRNGSRYLRRLDLAYTYVEVAPNDFRWLGGQLGLSADVRTESIQLPEVVSAAISSRPLVELPERASSRPSDEGTAPKSAEAAPAPSPATVAQVFDHWRAPSGEPVLAHFVACLKLDLKKKSPTRYECVEPVKGPVAPNTQVFGWADWLVPRGSEFQDIALEFVYDGQVRLSRTLPVRGRVTSPVVPTTAGAKLSQQGIYTLRLRRGDQTLAQVAVEVR